jgi:uncharacterized damage-inducible protein DinB
MVQGDPKADLHDYLRDARKAVLWKLEGLTEYDVRRPLVPTGTNLLGLVKHLVTVEWGHFGAAFGRPFEESLPWVNDDAEPNADMWATADESRERIVGLYRRVAAHSDVVIDALPLDAVGHVPWWPPEFSEVTLHRILVHTIAEAHRHAGHADIVRELVDGAVGFLDSVDVMPSGDRARYRAPTTSAVSTAPEWGPGSSTEESATTTRGWPARTGRVETPRGRQGCPHATCRGTWPGSA